MAIRITGLEMNGPSLQRTLQKTVCGRTAFRDIALWRGQPCNRRPASSLPTVAQQSFWKSLIPKPFRSKPLAPDAAAPRKRKSKDWNPATFYIIVFLLIGSMSIHMVALRRDFATFMRQSDVKIGLLREVVERIQKGEEVDVEQALGTGNPEKELDWEERTTASNPSVCDIGLTHLAVLQEIERDDTSRAPKKQDRKTTPPVRKAQEPDITEDTTPGPKTSRSANFF